MTLFTQEGLKSTQPTKRLWLAMHEALHAAYQRMNQPARSTLCGFDASGSMSREDYNIAVDVAINAMIPDALRPKEVELPFPLLLRF